MYRLRLFEGVEHAERHGIAVVVQAGVADHALAAYVYFHQLGQFAETPIGHAGVLGRRLMRLGELLLRLPAPLAAQFGQITALAELTSVFVN